MITSGRRHDKSYLYQSIVRLHLNPAWARQLGQAARERTLNMALNALKLICKQLVSSLRA